MPPKKTATKPPAPTPLVTNPADIIKSSLSPESCSATVVTLLNGFFCSPPPPKLKGQAAPRKRPTAGSVTPAAPSAQERHRLAIEVVNSCMRGLTVAASHQKQSPSIDTNDAMSRSGSPTSNETQILKSRALNQRDGPVDLVLDPIDHLASCCSISLSYLQSIEKQEGLPEAKPLQTETGRLSLATKLMQISKFKFALKELKTLKRRLEAILNAENGCSQDGAGEEGDAKFKKPVKALSKKRPSGKENSPLTEVEEHENLSKVLDFANIKPTSPALALVIGCQLGILRCIVGLKRLDVIEAVIPSFSAESSTLRLLKALAKSSPTKALTYVNMLSQVLSSLTAPSPVNADQAPQDSKNFCSPNTALTLQALNIECISLLRSLRPDSDVKQRNLWDQFSVHLAAFSRRTFGLDSQRKRDRYVLVRNLIERLRKILSKDDSDDRLPNDILKFLSWAASEAHLAKESQTWTREWLNALNDVDDPANETLVVLCKVRLAVVDLNLSRPGKSEDFNLQHVDIPLLEHSVGWAVDALEHVSRGRKQDLELLLKESDQLRRSSLNLLLALLKQGPALPIENSNKSHQPDDGKCPEAILKRTCESAIRVVIKFCAKYPGIGLSELGNSTVMPVLRSAVEGSLLTCWRNLEIQSPDAWEHFDRILKECMAVASTLEKEDYKSSADSPSIYEKISDCYWQAYLLYRKQSELVKEAVRALRRSISALDNRPASEISGGNLLQKCERLGSIFLNARDFLKAEGAFLDAITAASKSGHLNSLGDRALRGEPVFRVSNGSDREAACIGRVLAGLIRISNRNKDGVAAALRFDNEDLSPPSRGVLLEWCLCLAGDSSEDCAEIIRILGERLEDLYDLEEMPLRRARVVVKLLGLSVDQPGILNDEVLQSWGEEILEWAGGDQQLDEDEELRPYSNDIIAACYAEFALSSWNNTQQRPELIEEALNLWRNIINDADDWEGVLGHVDNPEIFARRLQMLGDYYDMKGDTELKIASLSMQARLRELQTPPKYDELVRLYSILGLEYHRLGYSKRAGMSLLKCQPYISKGENGVSTVTRLQWHLAYTEYLIGIGNLDKGANYLTEAGELARTDEDAFSYLTSTKQMTTRRLVADAAYTASLLAFEKGDVFESVIHVKRSLKLNHKVWATLERASNDARAEELKLEMETLSLSDKKTLPGKKQGNETSLRRPNMWQLVSAIQRNFSHLAVLYRHLGMVREARCYADEALKVVRAVDATKLVAQTLTLMGDLKIRSGLLDEGEAHLNEARELCGNSRVAVSLDLALGNLEKLRGDLDAELEAYNRALEGIDKLLDVKSVLKFGMKEREVSLDEQLANLSIDDSDEKPPRSKTPTQRPKTPSQRPRTPAQRSKTPTQRSKTPTQKAKAPRKLKSAATAKDPVVDDADCLREECFALLRRKGHIQRLVGYALAVQNQCEPSLEMLEEAAKLPTTQHEAIFQGLAEARSYLQQALCMASASPVYDILLSSAISLPNITMHGEVMTPSKPPVKKGARKANVKKVEAFMQILERARDCVYTVHEQALRLGSSSTVQRTTTLLGGIIVLLSAMASTRGRGPQHPLFASYSLELQKAIVTRREKVAVETERLITAHKETLEWPKTDTAVTQTLDSETFEFSKFQNDFINIIPEQWVAVSVSLSESKEELYISRFQAGKSHFLVRLPLVREHTTDEDEDDALHYAEGLEMLQDIIRETNENTHSAKKMIDKDARQQWWQEREELDNRLQELLEQIEFKWLGGFQGLLRPRPRNQELFARFKASFDKILAKGIPSRKKKKAGRVDIDHRILELFIALGSPEERGEELESLLKDLFNCVVDILLFHGEENEYAEIDFDVMTIAMTDALKAYHEADSDPRNAVDHTILILEKSVQMFPWESLPCLRGHSVSRIPSLAALRDRILQMQSTNLDQPRPGYYISDSKGGYILNPDSDLKNTQKLFQADLQSLAGDWTRIVNRAPKEEEFKDVLHTKDVFLYFGHGSGAHYMNPKSIRRLDRCAVACLFGCSSGRLEDLGEFEPYGPPTNYLLAGSAAVLAMLWDVTDKDIDKFSKDVFEKWGLLKGKGGARQKMSLVEAVAGARESCHMKYLNGAAPVVYGIPVYITEA